jgi:hypothetical protein
VGVLCVSLLRLVSNRVVVYKGFIKGLFVFVAQCDYNSVILRPYVHMHHMYICLWTFARTPLNHPRYVHML